MLDGFAVAHPHGLRRGERLRLFDSNDEKDRNFREVSLGIRSHAKRKEEVKERSEIHTKEKGKLSKYTRRSKSKVFSRMKKERKEDAFTVTTRRKKVEREREREREREKNKGDRI